MEWGDITPLRTKINRLEEGDLFVTVVNRYGLQTDNATQYCMEVLRPTGIALATMRSKMEVVCQFHNWCGDRGIDFIQRLESGVFFTQREENDLREALRNDLRKSAAKKKAGRKARPVVGAAHWRNRCAEVRDYVVWHAEPIIRRISALDVRQEARAQLASFKENIVDGIRGHGKPMALGLTTEQSPVFIAAITPDSPTNPFAPATIRATTRCG
ncbi:hypothetical protein ACVME8_006521 [Bradyrhizobium diazoefficiens]